MSSTRYKRDTILRSLVSNHPILFRNILLEDKKKSIFNSLCKIHEIVQEIKSKIKWQYSFNTESLCFNNVTNPIEIR